MEEDKMPRAKVGDINMYYEVHGKGEPFVMICGQGGSTQDYAPLIPVYSREFKLLLFDNRGSGQTDAPDIPYTMEMLADDLAGLLDAIGIAKAHISGTSFGGVITQHFALRHPEKVISLILQSTTCGGPGAVPLSPEVIETFTALADIPPEERAREMLKMFITPAYAEKHPDVIQRLFEQMTRHSATPRGMNRGIQASREARSTCDRLREIKAPTLIIAGEADRVVSAENARIMAARIPGAELVIFKDTGHMLIESAHELNRITLDFLRRHSTKKA
jgi:pimeloyl-ACP methyl ester carboxylesterase